jgi:hypothetical protein
MTLPLVQLVFAAFEVVIRSIATTTNTEANPRFLRLSADMKNCPLADTKMPSSGQ